MHEHNDRYHHHHLKLSGLVSMNYKSLNARPKKSYIKIIIDITYHINILLFPYALLNKLYSCCRIPAVSAKPIVDSHIVQKWWWKFRFYNMLKKKNSTFALHICQLNSRAT